eukprot:6188077-Pleurochrysis_carterae.AAC.2
MLAVPRVLSYILSTRGEIVKDRTTCHHAYRQMSMLKSECSKSTAAASDCVGRQVSTTCRATHPLQPAHTANAISRCDKARKGQSQATHTHCSILPRWAQRVAML